jgi:hypothetical protein
MTDISFKKHHSPGFLLALSVFSFAGSTDLLGLIKVVMLHSVLDLFFTLSELTPLGFHPLLEFKDHQSNSDSP